MNTAWTMLRGWSCGTAGVLLTAVVSAAGAAPSFVVSSDYQPVPEGGTRSFTLWLNEQPSADVTGTVARQSGDADISVQSGSPFAIPRASWNTPVTITLAAAEDADSISGTAVIRISETSGNGIAHKDVTAKELENDDLIYVGGTLAGDETWADTTRDYVLTSSVTIPAGRKLTISPGVTVRHENAGYHGFIVAGTLETTDVTLLAQTRSDWSASNHRSAVLVQSGGAAILTRSRIYTTESGPTSMDGNSSYWTSAVDVQSGGAITGLGNTIQSLNTTRTPIGVRLRGGACTIGYAPLGGGNFRISSFVNLRVGIYQEFGAARQDIALCRWENCDWNLFWSGNVVRDVTLQNTRAYLVTPVTVTPAATLTLNANSSLHSAHYNNTLLVDGIINCVSATLDLHTFSEWTPSNVRHGVVVRNGGRGDFSRCTIQAREFGPAWNDGTMERLAAALHADEGGRITVQGGSLVANVTDRRTPFGISIGGATATINAHAATGPTSFSQFRYGIIQTLSAAAQQIERCNFNVRDIPMLLRGTAAANTTLRNNQHVMVSSLSIPAGVTLTLASGAVLNTSDRTLTVQSGGALVGQANSAMSVYRPVQVHGALSLDQANVFVQTYAYWTPPQRYDGFVINSGGSAVIKRCNFTATEEGPYWNDGNSSYWAAVILAQQASSVTIEGASFRSLNNSGNRRSGYGVYIASATATLVDAAAPVRRCGFEGFRVGVRQVFGPAAQNIAVFDAVDCQWKQWIGGDVTASQTVRNQGVHVATDVNIAAGATLTLAPQSELLKSAGVFLRVRGALSALQAAMKLDTLAYWEFGGRRHGIYVIEGGKAVLDRCDITTTETHGYSNDGNSDYWAAAFYVDDQSELVCRGTNFSSTNSVNNYRTGYAALINGGAVCMGACNLDPVAGNPRNTFTGFRTGIHQILSGKTQSIETSTFTDCQNNIFVRGDLTTACTFRNSSMVQSGNINVKTGATLTLAGNSELSTGAQFLTVEAGGTLAMTAARLNINNSGRRALVISHGTVNATLSTIIAHTHNWWDDGRRSGFELMPGSTATFQGCSLYAVDMFNTNAGDYYAALIDVRNGASLTANKCFFTSLPGVNGFLTRYNIWMRTGARVDLTQCGFYGNQTAIRVDGNPASHVIQHCDFSGNQWAINNVADNTITALQNYWGAPSGPTHAQNPGGTGDPVSDRVDYGQNLLSAKQTWINIVDPPTGQLADKLTLAASQTDVLLFIWRADPSPATFHQVGFALYDIIGVRLEDAGNFRLRVDANGNGTLDPGENATLGGVGELRQDGGLLRVVFRSPFNVPAGANLILVGDFTALAPGDRFSLRMERNDLRVAPGAPVTLNTSAAHHAIGGVLALSNPLGGQQSNNLNSLAVQNNVSLMGLRLTGQGTQATSLRFTLSNVVGFTPAKFASVVVIHDANGNGARDAGEIIVSTTSAISISGVNGEISFGGAFPAGRTYLLVANLANINENNQLTVSLTAAGVIAQPGVTVFGSTTSATHIVPSAYVLGRSNSWLAPLNFGASVTQTAFSLLGLRIEPLGRRVESVAVALSSAVGISASEIANARLFWDANDNGVLDAADTLISNGVVRLEGGAGSITFATPFDTRGAMLVVADFAGLANGNEITVGMAADDVIVPFGLFVTGAVQPVRYVVNQGAPNNRSKNQNWTLTYRSPGGFSVNGQYNNAGDKVILGYNTGSAWIYDASSNTPLLMLKDHYDIVRYAGFNSDDTAAITVTRDGAVYIWDVNTGVQRSAMFSDLLVTYAVPSPDFSKLMVITEGKGILLDIDNQRRLWEFIPGAAQVSSIAYSPDGNYVLIGSTDRRAYLLNAVNGVEVRRYLGHSQTVTAVGFTGDGSFVMTGSTDATVNLWSTLSGPPPVVVRSIELQGQQAQGAAVSPDGSRVAMVTGSGASAQLRVFNEDGLEMYAINLSNESGGNWGGTLDTLTFDRSGQRILVTSRDSDWARLASFQTINGRFIRTWGPQGRFSTIYAARPRISADGERIFYMTDYGMNLISRATDTQILRSPHLTNERGFEISDDGNRLVWLTANGRLRVDSVSPGGFAPYLDRDIGVNYNFISLSPAGDRLVAGDRLYSAMTGSLLANSNVPDAEFFSKFSDDGTLWGFTEFNRQVIRTYRTRDRNVPPQYRLIDTQPYRPATMFFHPDGRRVAAVDRDTGVQMYDMDATPEPLPVGLYRFPGNSDAALSKDGTMLLIGGRNVVRLFDVRTGRVLRYFYPQHSSLSNVDVRAVQFAKNDTLIMIAWSYNYIELYERTAARKLEITPIARTLAPGETQAFKVEVVYDDTTRADVSPRVGQTADLATIQIDPPGAATVEGNLVTVAAAASGQFVVRALYRENANTFTAEALVTVGESRVIELIADPTQVALNPGVFRSIRYTARFDDGYETDVSPYVVLTGDRPEDVVIAGQSVKIEVTAPPGDIVITGTYTDAHNNVRSATTTLINFGLKTVWQRSRVTAGGYGLSGSFSPDGKQLLTGWSSGAMALYNVGVTPSQYSLEEVLTVHDGQVIFAAYTGANNVVTVSDDGTIKTWLLTRPGAQLGRVFRHVAPLTCSAMHGTTLAFGDTMGNVGAYNTVSGATVWVVAAHQGEVRSVAIDGDTVLSGGADGRLKLLERTNGAERRSSRPHTQPITAVGFTGPNSLFSFSEDTTGYLWRKDNLQALQLYEFPSAPISAEFVGGLLYVSTVQPVASWVYNTDGLLLRWLEHPPSRGAISKFLVDPSGSYILTGRKAAKVIVSDAFGFPEEIVSAFSSFQFWEIGRGIFRGSLAHSHSLSGAHASADGRRIFTQDAKRTQVWHFNIASGTASENRLLETGYFIGPSFGGMDFTADSSLLATNVGISIYMFNTNTNMLFKTLHVPNLNTFTISPNGTRMGTSGGHTRMYDLANLNPLFEVSRVASALDFRNNNQLLGALYGDKSIFVWNDAGLPVTVATTQYSPNRIFVNSLGDRTAVITEKIEGDFLSQTINYYLEIFNTSGLDRGEEPVPLGPPIFLLSISNDTFGGGEESVAFAVAVSDDSGLALVGASGDRPVRLISTNDGSTLREFRPPSSVRGINTGAAAVGFLENDTSILLGWAEGYAEIQRRSNPVGLDLVIDDAGSRSSAASITRARAAQRVAGEVPIAPGAKARGLTFAQYENGEELNVTSTATLSTPQNDLLSITGSLIEVKPGVTHGVAVVRARYVELNNELEAEVTLRIGSAPTPTPASPWDLNNDGKMDSLDLFRFSRQWDPHSNDYGPGHLLELIQYLK